MNAICGVVFDDGRPDARRISLEMIGRMHGRGHQEVAVWDGGSMALACASNGVAGSVADVAVVGPYVAVADARFDNPDDLLDRLGMRGREATPAVLIAKAFEKWGLEGVQWIRGDFAYAVLDTRDRGVALVRDRFGIRPLHYTVVPGQGLAFASDLVGLFGVFGAGLELDEMQLGAHLTDLIEDPERTIYQGLKKVAQSQALRVQRGAAESSTYYGLRPEPSWDGRSIEDCVEGFRARFLDAVNVRMDGGRQIGAHLSGGLDSSAVTVAAREQITLGKRPLHTYSLVFPSVPEANERLYIDAIIDQGGITPHFVAGDSISPLENLTEVYQILDDMVVGGNQHTIWLMLQQASADGTDVMLDGIDGDNAVGHGYGYLADLARANDWRRFGEEAGALVLRYGDPDHSQEFETVSKSVDRIFRRYGLPALDRFARTRQVFRLLRGMEGAHRALGASRKALARVLLRTLVRPVRPTRLPELPEKMLGALDPGFVSRTHLRDRLEAWYAPDAPSTMRDQQATALLNAKMAAALSGLNQLGAAWGVEPRHPFMDQALLEYALSLPPELSLHAGWTRFVLREALKPEMPDLIRSRIGKADASAILGRSFVGRDRHRIDRALEHPGVLANYLNLPTVHELRRSADDSDVSYHDASRVAVTLFATAAVWLSAKIPS